jgi:uncharacterized protein
MPVFAVLYHYADGSDALRDEHRPAHREFLNAEHGDVEVLAFGAWADDDTPGALIIARGPDAATVASTMDSDPFRTVGAVVGRDIREWSQAKTPWSE